jgi:calcium-translocating P-type ATPase
MNDKDWYQLNSEEVINKLNSNEYTGLNFHQVKTIRALLGRNQLPESKQRSIFSIFIHQFLSPLIYLLIFAALIALFLGDYKDATVILVVVILNSLIGAFQEGKAEQSLAALKKLTKLKTRVLRDKEEKEIEAYDLVPGDIILLNAGDAVPSDARVLLASNARVAEAALTGESLPVEKSSTVISKDISLADRKNMLYAGTHITSGRLKAIVTSIGKNNEIGKIAHLTTNTKQTKTQLEIKIHEFGKKIAITSIIIFILVLVIGMIQGIAFKEIFMIAVSQMVSLVPEGLPVALTIALAVGVQRMAKKGTVVRKLSAVETLGSTTIICTDKTGTLTKNEMTVTKIYLAESDLDINVEGVGYEPNGKLLVQSNSAELDKMLLTLILCNDSTLIPPQGNQTQWSILGDPTEAALLTLALKAGIDINQVKIDHPRISEIPFDSETKMMCTENGSTVYIKGAPEQLLSLAGPLSPEKRNRILKKAQEMADQSLRVLAIGIIPNSHIDLEKSYSYFQNQLVFLGLVGELDPPRDEVKHSVKKCLDASIKPVMVTGDHKSTALTIAKSLGIYRLNDLAIDGAELELMSDKELHEKIDKISVFARVHPAQKMRIVQTFQDKGNIVAMTGDGVNDAPALIKANVGVAMGITGTEVAKEAAKIIITDDNFSTIVAAIAEGRLVYQNIKKLLLFLFVTSIDEVIILFLALISGYPPPLAAVQILWINLVAEGALTINLIMEPAEGDEMKRIPVSINEPLLNSPLLKRIPLMVIASVASTYGWFIYRTSMGLPSSQVQTETFTVLGVSQWFNVLNCRSETRSALSRSLFKNPYLLGGLALANVMQVLVIYWRPLGNFFHTVPIPLTEFFAIGVVASLVLWVEEIRKYIIRKKINS